MCCHRDYNTQIYMLTIDTTNNIKVVSAVAQCLAALIHYHNGCTASCGQVQNLPLPSLTLGARIQETHLTCVGRISVKSAVTLDWKPNVGNS